MWDRPHGIMNDIFDGRVARNVLGPDGLPFFRHDEAGKTGLSGELRIGLTLGADWYVWQCEFGYPPQLVFH